MGIHSNDLPDKNFSTLFMIVEKIDIKGFYDKEILDYKREYSKWFALI